MHPWRQAYAATGDPYVIWVSEVMLQQTSMATVSPKYTEFIKTFADLNALASASEHQVLAKTAGLGYYRRFQWLHQAAKDLVAKRCAIPRSFEDLLKLKGIGTYSAAAIASICFGEAVPCIDGNVKRVICRVYDLRLPLKAAFFTQHLFSELQIIMGSHPPGLFNEALMELGQKVCVARTLPHCYQCPLSSICLAHHRSSVSLNPVKPSRFTKTPLFLAVHLITHGNQVLLARRPRRFPVLKGTLGFVTHIRDPKTAEASHIVGEFQHHITRYKISVIVTHGLSSSYADDIISPRWVDEGKAASLLVSSLDIKAWKSYLHYREANHH